MSTILLSLILFNGIIIFYIVIRFKGLFATERNPIVISFVLAFVFQEIFSLLIPFGSKFGDYLSLSVINTIGVLSGLIATHFFFEFAHRLYLFALSPSDVVRNNITKFIGSLSLDTIIRIERVSLAVAIVGILFFESYLGRSTSNTLTTLAVDIHHVPSLLVGRIISHTFIVFYDTCTAYILYLLTRTGYGRRRHIRLRIIFAIAGAFFVVTNEFSNLITTISIFFLPSSADSVLQVWGFYDRFVLLPLGICIIVSAGPVFVVIFVDRLVLYFESLLLLRRVTWLRNILVERFPEVDTSSFLIPTPLLILPTQLQAYLGRVATESSDALHFLFQYISLDEVVHEIELQGSNVQDEYALEAKLVWRGLSRKLDGEPTADKDTAQSYEFPTKRVLSLVELLRALALLSSKLRKREK